MKTIIARLDQLRSDVAELEESTQPIPGGESDVRSAWLALKVGLEALRNELAQQQPEHKRLDEGITCSVCGTRLATHGKPAPSVRYYCRRCIELVEPEKGRAA